MIGLINEISTGVIFNIVSMLVGCILAYPLYFFLKKINIENRNILLKNIAAIVFAAVIGAVLPLGTYGIIPLVIAAYVASTRMYLILPFFISNYMFNMTMPFVEDSFTWKTGQNRMILAIISAIIAGIILIAFKDKVDEIFFKAKLKKYFNKGQGIKGVLSFFKTCLEASAIFLVVGVIADCYFKRYMMYDVLKSINASAFGASAFRYMNGFNVMSPLFVLAMSIVNLLMNITKLSALAFAFKIRGLILYLIYICLICGALASSIYFIK